MNHLPEVLFLERRSMGFRYPDTLENGAYGPSYSTYSKLKGSGNLHLEMGKTNLLK